MILSASSRRSVVRAIFASTTALTMMTGSFDRSVQAETSGRVVNIALEDQFRTRRETGQFLGDVVVLVFA